MHSILRHPFFFLPAIPVGISLLLLLFGLPWNLVIGLWGMALVFGYVFGVMYGLRIVYKKVRALFTTAPKFVPEAIAPKPAAVQEVMAAEAPPAVSTPAPRGNFMKTS